MLISLKLLDVDQILIEKYNIIESMRPGQSASSRFASRPRTSGFEKDLDSYYLLLDIEGIFKNLNITCILFFKNIIPQSIPPDSIVKDLVCQLEKVGKIVKTAHKDKCVWVQYEKVQYAQIAYLMLMNHKYDGKPIDVSFYSALSFSQQF